MSLQSGKKISWSHYSKLPITQRVIDALNMMGKQQKQPLLATAGPTFMLHNKEIHERNDQLDIPEAVIENTDAVEKHPTLYDQIFFQLPPSRKIIDEDIIRTNDDQTDHKPPEAESEIEETNDQQTFQLGNKEGSELHNEEPVQESTEETTTNIAAPHCCELRPNRIRNYNSKVGKATGEQLFQFLQ